MRRRFVIGATELTSEDEVQLANYLQSKTGGSFWHWIDNLWLFTTDDTEVTASSINRFLNKTKTRGYRAIVFEFPPQISGSGYGPNKGDRDMFAWIKNTWLRGHGEDSE